METEETRLDTVNNALLSMALSLAEQEVTKPKEVIHLLPKEPVKSAYTLAIENAKKTNTPLVIFAHQEKRSLPYCDTIRHDNLTDTDNSPCVFVFVKNEWYRIKGKPSDEQIQKIAHPEKRDASISIYPSVNYQSFQQPVTMSMYQMPLGSFNCRGGS